MKNTIKVLGIIAIAAVIGFSFAACSDDSGGGGFNVKVVNNYAQPITKVVIDPRGTSSKVESSEAIAAGETKTFSLDLGKNGVGGDTSIFLYAEGLKFREDNVALGGEEAGVAKASFRLEEGKTATITLTADGEITK